DQRDGGGLDRRGALVPDVGDGPTDRRGEPHLGEGGGRGLLLTRRVGRVGGGGGGRGIDLVAGSGGMVLVAVVHEISHATASGTSSATRRRRSFPRRGGCAPDVRLPGDEPRDHRCQQESAGDGEP